MYLNFYFRKGPYLWTWWSWRMASHWGSWLMRPPKLGLLCRMDGMTTGGLFGTGVVANGRKPVMAEGDFGAWLCWVEKYSLREDREMLTQAPGPQRDSPWSDRDAAPVPVLSFHILYLLIINNKATSFSSIHKHKHYRIFFLGPYFKRYLVKFQNYRVRLGLKS